VVFFGLFHGLVFLPVLLSMLGPDPYPTGVINTKSHHNASNKDVSKDKHNFRELKPMSKGILPTDNVPTVNSKVKGLIYNQVDTE